MSAFSRGERTGESQTRLIRLTHLVVLFSFLIDLALNISVDEYMFFEILKVRLIQRLMVWSKSVLLHDKISVHTNCRVNFVIDTNFALCLSQPEAIAYSYKIRPAKDFGNPLNFSITNAYLVPTAPKDACSVVVNVEDLEGEIK